MEAVEYVRNGTYTISAAAKKYGVPRTAITDYLRRKSDKVKKMGAPTMLTETEEKALVEYILYMSDRSLPSKMRPKNSNFGKCNNQCNQIFSIF